MLKTVPEKKEKKKKPVSEEMLGNIIAALLIILYVLSPIDIPVDASYCFSFQFLFRTIYAYSNRFVRGGKEEG